MKTVLILSQFFHPDVAATGQVLTQLAEDLTKHGIGIKVITGQPTQNVETKGEILRRETYCGIDIWRVNYLRLNKQKRLGRIIGYLSFFLAVIWKIPSVGKFDDVLIVSNPPILPLVGHCLKKIKKIQFTYLLHDLYPDVAILMGATLKNSLFSRIMNWVQGKVFLSTDNIVVLGRDAKLLLEEKGVSPEKIKVITNWADKEIIDRRTGIDLVETLGFKNRFVIMYTGNLGLFYDFHTIIHVMEKLKDIQNLLLVFIGEGGNKEPMQQLVKEKGLNNIKFFPFQPKENYGDLLNVADILLVTLAKGLEGISVPSKTYGYLAAGKPILAVVPKESEIGLLVVEDSCGLRVDPKNIDELEDAIRRLYFDKDLQERLGKLAKQTFDERFQRHIVTRRFLDVL
jgi:glycosyltransferase involved in cell wall biosynthesis